MLTVRSINKMNPDLKNQVNIDVFVAKFNMVLQRYNINTRLREVHFFTQLMAESSLELKEENLNYSAPRLQVVWPNRFNASNAFKYAYNPEALANNVYANRLGNDQPGDGYKYRGRGYIQLTGKSNYGTYGKLAGFNLVEKPELLMQIGVAAIVAGAFWDSHNLNKYADADDITSITRAVNGSTRTVPERLALYKRIDLVYGL